MMTPLIRAVLLSLLVMLLVGCAAPEYTPDAATLATREQAEYDMRAKRLDLAWNILMGAVILFLALLFGLSLYLSRVAYRIQAAGAAGKEADARRKLLVDLGEGRVLELIPGEGGQGVIHGVTYQAAPEVRPAMRADTVAQAVTPRQAQGNGLQKFILDAAVIAGWDSDIIPRWERWGEKNMTMTGAEWMRQTGQLVALGLIEKQAGSGTTVVDGQDLRWLYDSLPTPPANSNRSYAQNGTNGEQ